MPHGKAAPWDAHATTAEVMAKLPPEWRDSPAMRYVIFQALRRAHKAGYHSGRRKSATPGPRPITQDHP